MPGLPKKILIIRNDKIGDFTLALPCFALVRKSIPDCEIHALIPEYTRDIAESCTSIDKIIIDPGKDSGIKHLKKLIHDQSYDVVLTLYSTTRVGMAVWLADIKHRFAPATKFAQIFYNHKLVQRRSKSLKPEYEYNLDLTRYLIEYYGLKPASDADINNELISVSSGTRDITRKKFISSRNIDPDSLLVFIHPGHGGSANNLTIEQYARIAEVINNKTNAAIIISAGPGEYDQAHKMASIIDQSFASVYESREGLRRFIEHISICDIFISGSTGPLHIAGALNRPTAGFYTNRQSATSLRWQTLSSDERRLAFSPPPEAEKEDMSKVDINNAALEIVALLNSLYHQGQT